MNTILEKLKAYFVKKENVRLAIELPDEFCPYCWKHDNLDKKYETIFGTQELAQSDKEFENFVTEIAKRYQGTVQNLPDSNLKLCLSCNNVFGDV